MRNKNPYNQDPKPSIFRSLMRNEEMDESTFNVWKDELLKELPSFWEEINEGFKKR